MSRGKLYTVSAPSGAGKTSLVAALAKQDDRVQVSVSVTTRPMRSLEQEGKDYFFVDDDAFQAMIARGEFLEYADVFGYWYGTAQQNVEQALSNGLDVILEIDWQGAGQVRQLLPDTTAIFIFPPSQSALRDRLTRRGQDHQSTIERRMDEAKSEMSHYKEADYLIVNDNFDVALTDLQSIIRTGRLHQSRQRYDCKALLNELVGG